MMRTINHKLNHKPLKSWFVQVSSIALYVQYLLSSECRVVDATEYEFAIIGTIVTFAIKLAVTMAISMAVGALTAKKPPKPRHSPPAGIEQFSVPTADEGRSVQVLFGKKYIAGPNIVWYGNLKSEAIQIRQ